MQDNDEDVFGPPEDEFERPTLAAVSMLIQTAYDSGFTAAVKCALGLARALPKQQIELALEEMLAVMSTPEPEEPEDEDGPPEPDDRERLPSSPVETG